MLCGPRADARGLRRGTLERLGGPAPGSGRSALATDGVEMLYVTDVEGDALLVFHLRPRFELIRRVHRDRRTV